MSQTTRDMQVLIGETMQTEVNALQDTGTIFSPLPRISILSFCLLLSIFPRGIAVKQPVDFPHDTLVAPGSLSVGLNTTINGSLDIGYNSFVGGLSTVSYARVLDTGFQGVAGLFVDKDAHIVGNLVTNGNVSLSSSVQVSEAGLAVAGQVNTSKEMWCQGTIWAQRDLVVEGNVIVGAGRGKLEVFELASVRSLQARVDGKSRCSPRSTSYEEARPDSWVVSFLFDHFPANSDDGGVHALRWDDDLRDIALDGTRSECPSTRDTWEDS